MSQSALPTTPCEPGYTAPSWLMSHTPGHPANVTRETVQDALAVARRSLEVAGPKLLAVMLAEALTVFDLPSNWSEQSKVYVAALEDLPADLVRGGLQSVVRTYKYKFPKPASIREPVEQEYADRKMVVVKLERVLTIGKFRDPPRARRTPEELAEVERVMAEFRATVESVAEAKSNA